MRIWIIHTDGSIHKWLIWPLNREFHFTSTSKRRAQGKNPGWGFAIAFFLHGSAGVNLWMQPTSPSESIPAQNDRDRRFKDLPIIIDARAVRSARKIPADSPQSAVVTTQHWRDSESNCESLRCSKVWFMEHDPNTARMQAAYSDKNMVLLIFLVFVILLANINTIKRFFDNVSCHGLNFIHVKFRERIDNTIRL